MQGRYGTSGREEVVEIESKQLPIPWDMENMLRRNPTLLSQTEDRQMKALTLAEVVRDAIAAEKAAARFYKRLHDRTTDPQARRFLKGMAAEEARHAAILEVMAKRKDVMLPDGASATVDLVETAPAWKDAKDITIDQALEIAREAETQAALYYDALADGVGGELAAFFRDMARTEEQHIATVAQMKADREAWLRV